MDYAALAKQFGGTEQPAQQAPTGTPGDPPFMSDLSRQARAKVDIDRYDEGRKRLAGLDSTISSGQQTMSDLNEFMRLNRESSTGSVWQQITPDKQMFRNRQSMEMAAIQSRLGPSQRVVGSGSSSDRDVSLFLRGIPSTENYGSVNQGIHEDYDRKYKYAVEKRAAMQGHLDKFGNLGGFDTAWADRAKQPTAPARRAGDSEDRQALEWASANPRDPRAAEINRRLRTQ